MKIKFMVRRYSITDARAQLTSILDEVESGSSVELTRHGRAVAVMMSIDTYGTGSDAAAYRAVPPTEDEF